MALVRYDTGSSNIYHPVKEFAAVPEQQARDIIFNHAETMEQFESQTAQEMAESIRSMMGNWPTKNGRIPISVFERMAKSDDQATREAGQQGLDRADFYRGVSN